MRHTHALPYIDVRGIRLGYGRKTIKDDHHAEQIVEIAREVFGKGNDFAKKITYRVQDADPEQLIKQFRIDPNPRIAVTVDMIATGTDVKPIEVE